MESGEVLCSKTEETLGAVECEIENMKVQWKNINKCMIDTMSDLIGKVEKRGRKPWITGEMMGKMVERGKWRNVNNEEGKKNYR